MQGNFYPHINDHALTTGFSSSEFTLAFRPAIQHTYTLRHVRYAPFTDVLTNCSCGDFSPYHVINGSITCFFNSRDFFLLTDAFITFLSEVKLTKVKMYSLLLKKNRSIQLSCRTPKYEILS